MGPYHSGMSCLAVPAFFFAMSDHLLDASDRPEAPMGFNAFQEGCAHCERDSFGLCTSPGGFSSGLVRSELSVCPLPRLSLWTFESRPPAPARAPSLPDSELCLAARSR